MLSTCLTSRFHRISNMRNGMAGCALAWIIIFSGGVQGAEPATTNDKALAALIQQLGVDTSGDAAARGKLRALLAQGQIIPGAAGSDEIQEGLWSGVIERVYVDNMDAQGNLVPAPTQFFLHNGIDRLQIYFMDEAKGHAASGQKMVVRGYRTGNKALILETGHNRQDLLRFDQEQRGRKPWK